MTGNKLLSAFSYWSVVFAPIFFSIIVWIVGDSETKAQGKRVLWTRIIPSITTY
nr:hypothetical protein [Bacillus cereus]